MPDCMGVLAITGISASSDTIRAAFKSTAGLVALYGNRHSCESQLKQDITERGEEVARRIFVSLGTGGRQVRQTRPRRLKCLSGNRTGVRISIRKPCAHVQRCLGPGCGVKIRGAARTPKML